MMDKYALYSVWFLAGISLLALILSRELSALTVLSIILIVPFLFYLEKAERLKKIPWLENFSVAFSFIFALFRFFYLKANFLISVAEFLISFLLIKLAFKKERKDLTQIMTLSIFVFLSAATLATDFSFLFSFVLFAISLCAALTLYALSEGKETMDKPINHSDKKLLFQTLVRNAGITLALSVLFSISIFIFFPRLSLAIFQGTFLAPQHKSGFSDTVNLAEAGKIFEDASVAMRVEIHPAKSSARGEGARKSPLQEVNPLYLRGQTLSHFDGFRWTAGEKKSNWLVADAFRSRVLKAQKVVRNRFPILTEERKSFLKKNFSLQLGAESFLTQKIYLESLEGAQLFAVPWVEEISAKLPQLSVAEDFTLQRPGNFSGRMVYEVRSILERPEDKRVLRQGRVGKGEELQKYLKIPEMDFSRSKELLKKIVSKNDSPFIQAKKIEKFLREEFQYSLENPVEKSSNPVEKFLFETKRGHCEYFASAMALLLRLAGIPSRVVTGFLAQEWNPNPLPMGNSVSKEGGYFLVRGKDAHAWVEAFVGGVGYPGSWLWLEFDPSPRIASADLGEEGFWALFKRKLDYLNFLWNAYVLSYDMESQKQLAKNVELKSVQFSRKLDSFFAKGREWLQKRRGKMGNGMVFDRIVSPFYLLPIFLLLLSVWIGVKLKYYFKNKGAGKAGAEFYRQMLGLLARKGVKKLDSETPLEFAMRAAGELAPSKAGKPIPKGEIVNAIDSLTLLFCKIRYSGYRAAPSDLAEANRSLSWLKHSL